MFKPRKLRKTKETLRKNLKQLYRYFNNREGYYSEVGVRFPLVFPKRSLGVLRCSSGYFKVSLCFLRFSLVSLSSKLFSLRVVVLELVIVVVVIGERETTPLWSLKNFSDQKLRL